ncbi:hypothetical protein [Emticicia agri]|uniref:Uncharacterized protein n=1 Tax=Emticicia agri TaxID=2492393 RepID=A0A4Q5M3I6_9BACT|nr:hypothetical protein [Emticicia agri]RYU96715.1 hypothetical protein EWM59_06070 [Emticicia agri]
MKIRCPKCSWEPDGGKYWQCHCGHIWNTFETIGRCPSCHYQHEYTQCVPHAGGCDKKSPHLDWYEGLDKIVEEFIEEVFAEEDVYHLKSKRLLP